MKPKVAIALIVSLVVVLALCFAFVTQGPHEDARAKEMKEVQKMVPHQEMKFK
jgi:hypothetical protein